MAGSQGTFATRIGRYKNANTLIQIWADYNPSSAIIKKASNTDFIKNVEAANVNATAKKDPVDSKKAARALLCFTHHSPNAEIGILNPD